MTIALLGWNGQDTSCNKSSKNFVANHACLTDDEMLIPLIAVMK